MRGVTMREGIDVSDDLISTRTPHAGSDTRLADLDFRPDKFQPALPMRGVTGVPVVQHGGKVFQPALPMRGVTGTVSSSAISSCVFQPALPMRGVTAQ